MLKKIISGGQTGADRAALDAAIRYNIPHGGAIPRGRRTEEGVLPGHYNLMELQSDSYPVRTEQNVVDSDATVIFSHGPLSKGSLLTQKMAVRHNRPVLHLDLRLVDVMRAASLLVDFVRTQNVETLNIAGPRASGDPYIYNATLSVLAAAVPSIVASDLNRNR